MEEDDLVKPTQPTIDSGKIVCVPDLLWPHASAFQALGFDSAVLHAQHGPLHSFGILAPSSPTVEPGPQESDPI